MSAKIGADTDLLNSAALTSVRNDLNAIANKYLEETTSGSLGQQRSDIDRQITTTVKQSGDVVHKILKGLTDLSKGDIGNVDQLSELLRNGEYDNIRDAKGQRKNTHK